MELIQTEFGTDSAVIEEFLEIFSKWTDSSKKIDFKTWMVESKAEHLLKIVQLLQKRWTIHLSTIIGLESEEGYELIYPTTVWVEEHEIIKILIKIIVDKPKASISSIVGLIPGAIYYEREIHEMLGVNFEGHPDLSYLFLPDDWPKGLYPLRKEHTSKQLRERYDAQKK